MEYQIAQLTTMEDLARCAAVMVRSDPWAIAHQYTERACTAALLDEAVEVHGLTNYDGALLGFVGVMPKGMAGEPLIEYLCVDEPSRNRGLGGALVNYFETKLFPHAHNLYLCVSDINPDAQRFYRRLGYGQIGAMGDFYRLHQTEFIYRKTRGPRILSTPGGLGAPS